GACLEKGLAIPSAEESRAASDQCHPTVESEEVGREAHVWKLKLFSHSRVASPSASRSIVRPSAADRSAASARASTATRCRPSSVDGLGLPPALVVKYRSSSTYIWLRP